MKACFAFFAGVALVSVTSAQVVIDSVAESFSWSDPFGAHTTPPGFAARCESTATFRASQHVISEIHQPPPVGLAPWIDAIKYFFGGRPFPGSWDGVDARGINRDVIKMEYTDLPPAVKNWIQEQKEKDGDSKWLFGVYEKPKGAEKIGGTARVGPTAVADGDSAGAAEEDLVVLFAAGAVYETLPLWVAGQNGCESDMLDLEKYSSTPSDGTVVGWIVERTVPDWESKDRDISFKVKAQLLRETEEERKARLAKQAEAEAEATEKTATSDGTSMAGKDEL